MFRVPSLPAPPVDPSLMSTSSSTTPSSSLTPASPRLASLSRRSSASTSSAAVVAPSKSNGHPVSNGVAQTSTPSFTTVETSPPRQFDGPALRPELRRLLSSKFSGASWDRDRERVKIWCKEVGAEAKRRMLEIEPSGYKFAVCVQAAENLGQGLRADLSCHWDGDSDAVVQAIYSNDTIICTLIAFAIRVAY